MALESIESLTEKVNKLHSLGWRIEIHVIGDASVDAFLGALEACEFTPEQIRPFRHILNHSQMIRADQVRNQKQKLFQKMNFQDSPNQEVRLVVLNSAPIRRVRRALVSRRRAR